MQNGSSITYKVPVKHFYLPKTEHISNEVLSLPMYPELSNEKVEFVIESVRKFYERPKTGNNTK